MNVTSPSVVYVIVSHRNPAQVQRLVRRLIEGSGNSHVLLHHDPSGDPLPTGLSSARLTQVTPRRPVRWGDSSDVHVFMDALHQARRDQDPDWLVFLSGQDYPVRSISDIEADLGATKETVLMDLTEAATNSPWRQGEASSRYAYRYLRRPRHHLAVRLTARLIGRQPNPEGRQPDDSDWFNGPRFATRTMGTDLWVGVRPWHKTYDSSRLCFVGSQWFSVSRRGIDIMLAADPGGALLRHYDHTVLPDESYFQTLVGNAVQRDEIGGSRRYILWTDSPHPELLTTEHLPGILCSGTDFARKFDDEVNASILDELDLLHG